MAPGRSRRRGPVARPLGLRAATAIAALGLGACGGSTSATTPSAPVTRTADATSARAAKAAGLSFYLLNRGDGTALKPAGSAQAYASAADFVQASGGSATATTRLKAEGFTGAMRQPTRDSNGAAGVSVVLRLGSAAGARAELAQQLTAAISVQPPDGTLKHFSIAAIPGSQGFVDDGGAEAGGATNVFFLEGRCVIGVGDATSANASETAYEAPVRAAAEAIYDDTLRGGGVCGG